MLLHQVLKEQKGKKDSKGQLTKLSGDYFFHRRLRLAHRCHLSHSYAALCSKDNKLTNLSFRGNSITDKGARFCLHEQFRKPDRLTTRCVGAEAIAKELRMNYKLDSLNLFCNRIGDVGGCAIAVAMRINGSITTLSLGKNSVTAVTCVFFVKCCFAMNSLLYLFSQCGRFWRDFDEVQSNIAAAYGAERTRR